jgi:hypothetical protein
MAASCWYWNQLYSTLAAGKQKYGLISSVDQEVTWIYSYGYHGQSTELQMQKLKEIILSLLLLFILAANGFISGTFSVRIYLFI